MLLGKKRKLGRQIEDMSIGEKLTLTEKIEDKDLLLFLGLTNDSNPLYIQHDYASQTPYKKPIVPSIMLTGFVTSAVSKYMPGPGSHLKEQNLRFPKPLYHYATIDYTFEVKSIDRPNYEVEIAVQAVDESGDLVLKGTVIVCPPHKLERFEGSALDNF
ncbi:MaoC/PaaZ C-terminal domain-containing protein [Jeotgalibacillus sp. R-1-5s-1]|uniref:MaoC/PaaZ C-terminal domain-containing protein n=1 Tax=Jeotgalibacillus sp. R-1-5s-1 TaxID=2555897 RepID=UPI00106988D8|nr:MaoC/PaaZ C-terminal domain-containing protein [Jeotgalibacillus sp. R-1-5s-1]TFD92489.1 enoyl-CoA hydratase [Jeotgalibacillus sp. R-1-5s-1]